MHISGLLKSFSAFGILNSQFQHLDPILYKKNLLNRFGSFEVSFEFYLRKLRNLKYTQYPRVISSNMLIGNLSLLLYPKGDGGLGTQNVERVGREGSLECVGTLKN